MDEGIPTAPATSGDTTGSAASLPREDAAGAAVQRRRSRSRRTFAAGALALSLLSAAAGGLVGGYLQRTGGLESVQLPQPGPPPHGASQPGPPPPGPPPGGAAGIDARALAGVVTLRVTGTGTGEQATGTGFVIDTRGHILTDSHVVAPATAAGGRITVTFSSGATARATVVRRDTGYDLAVVQVNGVQDLTPLPFDRPGDRSGSSDRN
ncbi:trypsin-like peptidase domain-containing protein [Streptomyces sp. NPDC048291]|uniref:trypsin-like peptidase domain-containing protein n=1 Tax=Streptomyces sp. NPDC048291 TaxID=3365530 RepID=UPI0037101BC9